MHEHTSVVILCGGDGLRFAEFADSGSKVMAIIGDRPMVWHIMRHYSNFGVQRFILCVKDSDVEVSTYFSENNHGGWFVDVVRTGEDTPTAGRILRVKDRIETENFFVTYGDGLSDVNILALMAHHKNQGLTATLTVVHPKSQYGFISLDKDEKVLEFIEKPTIREWINGGFFVFTRSIFELLHDNDVLEVEVLPRLAVKGQLAAYKHDGFWKSMDTKKELVELNRLYEAGMLLT